MLFVADNIMNGRIHIVRAENETQARELVGATDKTWVTVTPLPTDGKPEVIWDYEQPPNSR